MAEPDAAASDTDPTLSAPPPAPKPAPPFVTTGTVTVGDDGAFTWAPDPAVTYVDPPVSWTENGVVRNATAAEWAELHPANPPVVRILLRKSTVQARAQTASVLDAIMKVLQSQALLFAQWFAPDWPNVYADDPGLLQVLKAVGCTADQIATITAPDPAGPA